jgi:cellulose 1,4-beta-cellobiosidase
MLFILLSFFTFGLSLTSQNPFVDQTFYVNPAFQSELQSSIKTATGKTKENLVKIYNQSSAFWIDTISKISGMPWSLLHASAPLISRLDEPVSLKSILQDSSTYSPPHLIVVIVYDLPNRDCHAHASNGEICCTTNVWRRQVIDNVVMILYLLVC